MDQADRVLSTPPTTTPIPGPLFLPTDVTPEQIFVAIGQLRKEARDEVDRLLQFLDKTDDYVSRELEDSVDDNPQEEAEDEPSLGFLDHMTNQERIGEDGRRDIEDEHDGAEAALQEDRAVLSQDEFDDLCSDEMDQFLQLLEVVPTTMPGVVALVAHLNQIFERDPWK